MTTFRDDLDRAADWADAYLQRVADLPVTARVEPGEVRAKLPLAAPEQGEPFEARTRARSRVCSPSS
jgi:aromatic-L-amino-acid decarboxylase